MTRIIINADDLGINQEVDKAIENAIEKGVVSSASILANGNAYDDAIRIAKKYPQVSFGVHLNLIEFKPLVSEKTFAKYGIIDNKGSFIEGAIFVMDYYNEEFLNAVRDELDAQINKIYMSGVHISHIDSHQHTHTIPQLKEIIVGLMLKYNLKKIRRVQVPSIRLMLNAKKNEVVHLDKSNAVMPKKRNVIIRRFNLIKVIFITKKWNRFFSRRFVTTDSFFAYRTLYFNHQIVKSDVTNKTVELMCHPGHPAFEKETTLVLESAISGVIDYQLITYNDL